MRIYIATGLENFKQHNLLRDMLVGEGITLTYDWTVHGSVQNQPEDWAKYACLETQGVKDAHTVVAILPGGRGTHTEIGIALGMGKEVFLIGYDPMEKHTCIFYHHPKVLHFDSMLEAHQALVLKKKWNVQS